MVFLSEADEEQIVEGAYRLLAANRAIIDERKILEYALNQAHPVGSNKARVFKSVLGITGKEREILIAKIRTGVLNATPLAGKIDRYGARFIVHIPVTGPAGSGMVFTGWIFKTGTAIPELATIYVK